MWLLPILAAVVLVQIARWRASDMGWTDFLLLDFAKMYSSFWQRCRPGTPTYPQRGGALVVSNHTCSADPMLLVRDTPRMLSFVTTRQHINLSAPSRWLLQRIGCVGVKRDGRDPVGVRHALRSLQTGACPVPISGRKPERRGARPDARWKHGAAYLGAERRRTRLSGLGSPHCPRDRRVAPVYAWHVPANRANCITARPWICPRMREGKSPAPCWNR